MNRHTSWLAVAAAGIALFMPSSVTAQDATQPAVAAFDQLKAMAGDWIDVDGPTVQRSGSAKGQASGH